jgi:DHA1 family inner membrane transport protein
VEDVMEPAPARTSVVDALPVEPPRGVALAVLALALGGFGIGTSEFVAMGLLPEVSGALGITIPQAGHSISAYAVGVVIGAPLIAVLAARLPRKGILVGLMVAFAVGNAATAAATGYGSLVAARLLSGLPHGAYFGIAALFAASLVGPERRARAVASIMLGLSVANVVGVPAATWLGQNLGWRSAYLAVTAVAALTVMSLLVALPRRPRDPSAGALRELGALARPQVLLTLAVGTVGFGGMFAMYSYIAPLMTEVSGLGAGWLPGVLAVVGVGMVVGTWLAGHLVDRSVTGSLVGGLLGVGLLLALLTVVAQNAIVAVGVIFVMMTATSVLVLGLQVRLMDVAGDAQTLGAAMNHAALNAANALGAWLGGAVLAAGWGYLAPSWVGVGLAAAGLGVLAISLGLQARTPRAVLPATG